MLNAKSLVGTVATFKYGGKIQETIVSAFEAKDFMLSFSLFFTPPLGCKYFHFISEVVKTTDQEKESWFTLLSRLLPNGLTEISQIFQKSVQVTGHCRCARKSTL